MLLLLALTLSQAPLAPGAQVPQNHPQVPAPEPLALPSGHPTVDEGKMPSTEELIRRLEGAGDLKNAPKSFEVASSIGRLYLAGGRLKEAVQYLDQAVTITNPTRALYEAKRKQLKDKPMPPAGSVGCAAGAEVKFEELANKAKAQTDVAAAAACARAALMPLIALENELAHAKFLSGDAEGALQVHTRALALFESNPEARYGKAALLLDTRGNDVKSLKVAEAELERFLSDYPTSPRASQAKIFLSRVKDGIAAGGVAKVGPKARGDKVDPHATIKQGDGPPVLTKEMIDAVQNVERTPELEQGMDALVVQAEEHLAKGRFQEALDNYKRVVPFQPENARAKAGMAWSLVGLNKPMAPQVWSVAVQAPEAVDALGDALKAKGDEAGAKKLWAKLAESSPSYAPKLAGKY